MTMRHLRDMVRDQDPLMLRQQTSVAAACRHMRDRRVGAVLVVDAAGSLLGIFTGRDAVARVLAEGRSPSETRLADVMTHAPTTVPLHCTAIEALRLMQDGGFRHVPIVDGARVMGIVSRGDFRGLEQARLDEETGLWERI